MEQKGYQAEELPQEWTINAKLNALGDFKQINIQKVVRDES
jgi:hypothetical protein